MEQEEGQAIEQPTALEAAYKILDAEDSPQEEIRQEAPEATESPAETTEAPAETEPEAKTEEIQIDPDTPLFDVEEVLEGGKKEVKKLSLNDLKKQRMMQSDYTRKTQELAAQRKALPEEVKKMAEPQLKAAEQAIMLANQVVTELVAPELAGMTPQKMAELSQTDPAQFAALLGKQNLVASQIQNLVQRQRQVTELQQRTRADELSKSAQESVEILQRDIPSWSQEVYSSILKTGSEYGFNPAELGQVSQITDVKPVYFTDARIIKAFHELTELRNKVSSLDKGKIALEKKVAVVPKVMKPGTSEKPDPKTEAFEKAANKLKKTGRSDDAEALAKYFV